jgi:hypothetical protein
MSTTHDGLLIHVIQREHHQTQTFREEYLDTLRRHQIEFDERYVFDEEIVS